jgi:hypothetical protein
MWNQESQSLRRRKRRRRISEWQRKKRDSHRLGKCCIIRMNQWSLRSVVVRKKRRTSIIDSRSKCIGRQQRRSEGRRGRRVVRHLRGGYRRKMKIID